MAAPNKTAKLTTCDGKIIQYREKSDLAIVLLIKSKVLEKPLDLDELLTYSLFLAPYTFATANGFFAKTNKARMLHHLLETYIVIQKIISTLIVAMLWYTYLRIYHQHFGNMPGGIGSDGTQKELCVFN